MASKGERWNESETYLDPLTLRKVRKITNSGIYNQTPTYHTNTAFTADGQYLIFASARQGGSALMKANVRTGEITQLTNLFPGTGCLDEMHKGNGTCVGNGLGVTMLACIAPQSRQAVFVQGRSLRLVDLETLAESVLIENFGVEHIAGMPSVDPEEKYVILPLMPAHPDIIKGKRVTQTYLDYFGKGTPYLRILKVPLTGGPVEIFYDEKGVGGAHCPHNPHDGDLVLLDRDCPPKLWAGGGDRNRIWSYRISTAQLTELPSQDGGKFQVHSAWTWDGQGVIYHGPSPKGGLFIGIVHPDGNPWREYYFGLMTSYGHVSAMAGRPAIILDGNLSTDKIMLLYYDREKPLVEVIAQHNTNWGGLPWQYSHPHPQSDPSGKWISFNSVNKGRSDVFVVEI